VAAARSGKAPLVRRGSRRALETALLIDEASERSGAHATGRNWSPTRQLTRHTFYLRRTAVNSSDDGSSSHRLASSILHGRHRRNLAKARARAQRRRCGRHPVFRTVHHRLSAEICPERALQDEARDASRPSPRTRQAARGLIGMPGAKRQLYNAVALLDGGASPRAPSARSAQLRRVRRSGVRAGPLTARSTCAACGSACHREDIWTGK